MRSLTFAFLFSLAPVLCLAQNDVQPDLVPTHLQVTKTTKVKFTGGVVGDVRCDNAGNHYARIVPPAGGSQRDSMQAPVRRIQPDGKPAGVFTVPDNFRTQRFFVTGDSEVYQLASREDESANYILAFRSNGSVGATIRLQTKVFSTYQIPFFRPGVFFGRGVEAKQGICFFPPIFE